MPKLKKLAALLLTAALCAALPFAPVLADGDAPAPAEEPLAAEETADDPSGDPPPAESAEDPAPAEGPAEDASGTEEPPEAPEVLTAEEPSPAETAEEAAYAAVTSGTFGTNLRWELKDGVLTISYDPTMPLTSAAAPSVLLTGTMPDWTGSGTNVPPWYASRADIRSVVVGYRVANIGAYAFAGCTNLTSLSLPAGILSVVRDSETDAVAGYSGVVQASTTDLSLCERVAPKLASVGAGAFRDAPLTQVDYGGGMQDWWSISVGADNGALEGADVNYLYFPFSAPIPGDLTGDDRIDTADLLRLMKYILGYSVRTAAGPDVTGDGQVNALDLWWLLLYVSGRSVRLC